MALHNVIVTVGFLDSAERIAERNYTLRTQYDDVANNYDDVVTDAASLITALDVCTMDHIEYYDITMRTIGGGAAPNVAANNQVVAFTRVQDTDSNKGILEVPAWDDVVFDQDSNNLLNAAYNTAISAVALLTKNPDTGLDWKVSVDWTQSRTRKSGVRLD